MRSVAPTMTGRCNNFSFNTVPWRCEIHHWYSVTLLLQPEFHNRVKLQIACRILSIRRVWRSCAAVLRRILRAQNPPQLCSDVGLFSQPHPSRIYIRYQKLSIFVTRIVTFALYRPVNSGRGISIGVHALDRSRFHWIVFPHS